MPSQQNSSDNAFDSLAAILRHKLTIFVSILIGVAVAYQYTQQLPVVYESRAQVLINNRDRDSSTQVINTKHGFEDSSTSQALIAKSERIVKKAIELGELEKLDSLKGLTKPELFISSRLDIGQARLNSSTAADDILEFRYRSTFKDDCPTVLESVIKAYEHFLISTRENYTIEVSKIVSDASTVIGKQLQDLETEYREFRKNAPLIWEDGKARSSYQQQMLSIEKELAEVRLGIVQRQAEIEQVDNAIERSVNPESILIMLEQMIGQSDDSRSGKLAQEKKQMSMQIFEMLTQYETLSATRGSGHPDIKELDIKIEKAKSFFPEFFKSRGDEDSPIDYFIDLYRTSLVESLDTLKMKANKLSETFEKQQLAAREIYEYEIRNNEYQSKIENMHSLFASLVDRLNRIDALPDAGGIAAELILNPTSAYQVEPILQLNLFLGALGGLIVGSLISFLMEWLNEEYTSVSDIQLQLQAPVIGLLPTVKVARRNWFKRGQQDTIKQDVFAYHYPRSVGAHSIRRVANSLITRHESYNKDRERSKGLSFVLTSADVADGKTTVSSNLAVALTRSNKRVIIVDADLHRQTISSFFSMQDRKGLGNILLQQNTPDEVIVELSEKVKGLSFLPAGGIAGHNVSSLSTCEFAELIEMLTEQYDYVIIDAPPIYAVADTLEIIPQVDGALFVLRLTKHARKVSDRACDMIRQTGGHIAGVVVNCTDQASNRFELIESKSYYSGGYQYAKYSNYARNVPVQERAETVST